MYGHRKHPSSEAFLPVLRTKRALEGGRRVDRITLKLKISFCEDLCSSVAKTIHGLLF